MRILVSERLSEHKYKTPEGYLICTDAILARTGKQTYRKADIYGADCVDADEEIDVDRKYEEVFSKATLASFENKPITIEHPDEDVNINNYKDYAVGYVRNIREGDYEGNPVIIGDLVITDQKAIDLIESGEMNELSCGYDCDILDEDEPQQRNIRGNHLALCERGRAGIARIVDSEVEDTEIDRYFIQFINDIERTKYEEDGTSVSKQLSSSDIQAYDKLLRDKLEKVFPGKKIDISHKKHHTYGKDRLGNRTGREYYECEFNYRVHDSIKDEAIYQWLADPEDNDDKDRFESCKKAGLKIKPFKNGLYFVEGPASKMAKALNISVDNLEEVSKERMTTIKKLKDASYPSFLGYVNGTMKEFNPKELVDKVIEKRQALHTNRIARATDNMYILYHIVVDPHGTSLDNCRVYVDAVKETYIREDGDADDIRSYKFKETQDRVLMKDCGDGEDKWEKAIKILSDFKAKHLNDSVEDMAFNKKASVVPEHQNYYNDWTPAELKQRLIRASNKGQQTIVEGLLATLEEDIKSDLNNSKLDKEKTINHYKEYTKMLKNLDVDHYNSSIRSSLNRISQYGIKDSVNIEDTSKYIYLFAKSDITAADRAMMRRYGLEILGTNRFEREVNLAVKGDLGDLKRFCKEYMSYEMHRDYLYKENEFAGEITRDSIDDANKNIDHIIKYFEAWGYPVGKELQEAVDFYKLSRKDVEKVFGPKIGRTYDKSELAKLHTYDSVKDFNNDYRGFSIQVKNNRVEVWRNGKKCVETPTEEEAEEWVDDYLEKDTRDSLKSGNIEDSNNLKLINRFKDMLNKRTIKK